MMNEVGVQAASLKRISGWVKFGVEIGPLFLFFLANAYPKFFAYGAALVLAPSILSGPNAGLFTATVVLMIAVAAAARRLICFDTPASGRAVDNSATCALLWGADALFTKFDLYQNETNCALCGLWGSTHRRPCHEQIDTSYYFRSCPGIERARLAASHPALGRFFFPARDTKRNRMAQPIERCLGRLQVSWHFRFNLSFFYCPDTTYWALQITGRRR